jgi:hypothetical protein
MVDFDRRWLATAQMAPAKNGSGRASCGQVIKPKFARKTTNRKSFGWNRSHLDMLVREG